jgi:hypothetical protein
MRGDPERGGFFDDAECSPDKVVPDLIQRQTEWRLKHKGHQVIE